MKRKSFRAKTEGFETFVSNAARTPLGSILRHGLWRESGGPHLGRRLKHFCFVYTLAGQADYEDELIGKRRLIPGDLLLVHPNVAHRYGNGVGGWDEYFVLFEGPLFDLWKRRRLLDPRNPIIHLEPVSYWQHRLANCVEGEERRDLATNLKHLVDLLGFMTEVIGAQVAPDKMNARPWLVQACQRLEADLNESIDWNEFSRSFGLSFETFRKLFTRAMGVTPTRYRTAKIIDRACELSLHEHKLGKEIALELGFATEQHFSRRFKEITGLTLRQFRKQWLVDRK